MFASCLFAVAVQGALVLRDHRRRIPRVGAVITGSWMTISLSFLMIEGLRLLLDNADVLVIGQLLDPQSVAVYFATIRTGGLVAFVYFAVAALAVPRFSQIHATGTRADMQLFVSGIISLMFWPTVAAALALALLGPIILSIFGPGCPAAGYPVLLVILAGLVARAAFGPVEFLLNMTGHQMDTVRVYAAAAIADVALNLLLIPRFGILGAAIATYTAVIGANLCLCLLAHRRLGVVSFFWQPVKLKR
jgi:O-antigen/teichoic acid export membrane protein